MIIFSVGLSVRHSCLVSLRNVVCVPMSGRVLKWRQQTWLFQSKKFSAWTYIQEFNNCPTRDWTKWMSEPVKSASEQSVCIAVELALWSKEMSERCEWTNVASDRVSLKTRDCHELKQTLIFPVQDLNISIFLQRFLAYEMKPGPFCPWMIGLNTSL